MELYAAKSGSPVNVLKGIVPTCTTFSTPATDLANATDGDITTKTTTAQATIGSAGNLGEFAFDRGTTGPIIVSVVTGAYVSSGNLSVFIDESTDGNTYLNAQNSLLGHNNRSGVMHGTVPKVVSQRYFRVRFYGSASCNGFANLYEVRGMAL